MRVIKIVAILFIGALIIFTACAKSAAPTPTQAPNEVWAVNREFRPSVITVPVGAKVIWTNKDSEQHTVTSSTGLFDGTLPTLSSFSYIFTERGRFEYSCQTHSYTGMTGAIIVE